MSKFERGDLEVKKPAPENWFNEWSKLNEPDVQLALAGGRVAVTLL